MSATLSPESGTSTVFGHTVSDLQTDVAVNATTNKITGTLNYVDSGALATDWGEGYFLVLKWSGLDEHTDKLWVGLNPSEGSGLIECFDDPDRNGVFKITDKDKQKFVLIQGAEGYGNTRQTFDLSGLTLAPKS